jgi:hypothetical protein
MFTALTQTNAKKPNPDVLQESAGVNVGSTTGARLVRLQRRVMQLAATGGI